MPCIDNLTPSPPPCCRSLFDSGEAVKVPLTGSCLAPEMDTDTDPAADPSAAFDLAAARHWWAGVRLLDVHMGPQLISTAENAFVTARQANNKLDQSDFSRWLTLARLLAMSTGSTEVLPEHWQRMQEMETERGKRLS